MLNEFIKNKKQILTQSAEINVKTKETITKIVAMYLFDANIFLTWLTGPMRKQVLSNDVTFPRV